MSIIAHPFCFNIVVVHQIVVPKQAVIRSAAFNTILL